MDISGQYIAMCEKAEEIQKIFWAEWVDLLHPEETPPFFMLARNKTRHGYYELNYFSPLWRGKPVWLPRQDQLQEMIDIPFETLCRKIHNQEEFARHIITEKYEDKNYQFNSFKQLWLEIVMKEKYGKVWNGADWVKEG